MAKIAEDSNEYTETMYIRIEGDWTATEFEKFVWSIRIIYDVYSVLDMAKKHEMHEKTFDIVLNQLSKLHSMMKVLDWDGVLDPLLPLYQARGIKKRVSISKLFDEEFFGILSEFIHDRDRLLVNKIRMGSPGGITFSRRVKRFSNDQPAQQQKTPLNETKNFVNAIINDRKDINRELAVENRELDPSLLGLTGRIVYDGPVNIIRDLARISKIETDETYDNNS